MEYPQLSVIDKSTDMKVIQTRTGADRPDELLIHLGQSAPLTDRFFLRTENGRFEKVAFADLLWLEAERSYCRIVTRDRSILLPEPLNSVFKRLTYPHLMRIHRSYVVNTTCIDAIDHNVVIVNGQVIPISEAHQKTLFAKVRVLR